MLGFAVFADILSTFFVAVPKKILPSLRHEIPKVLAQRLEEKKLVAKTVVHTDYKAQTRYFDSKVKEIREQEQARLRFIRRNLRRMSNSFGSRPCGSSLIPDLSHELSVDAQ